jgi:hypothetical protein
VYAIAQTMKQALDSTASDVDRLLTGDAATSLLPVGPKPVTAEPD